MCTTVTTALFRSQLLSSTLIEKSDVKKIANGLNCMKKKHSENSAEKRCAMEDKDLVA